MMSMEFWGVEVKQGQSLKVNPQSLKVTPDESKIIHISQASLGEVKDDKAANKVPLRLKIGGRKFVIGTLSAGETPQIAFDLVLEKEFELSHDWKHGSVYFIGYSSLDPSLEDDLSSDDSSSSDEDVPTDALANGKPEPKVDASKKQGEKSTAAQNSLSKKPALKSLEAKIEDDLDSDEDDDTYDEDDGSEDSDEGMEDVVPSDEDDSEEDDSDDEKTQEKPKEQIKKRPAEPEKQAPKKKAKQSTPDKAVVKKATPAKQAGKSPQDNSNKGQKKKFNQKKH